MGLGAADAPRTLTFLDADLAVDAPIRSATGVAIAAAELGLKVVIVEADLRHPTLASRCPWRAAPACATTSTDRAGPRDVLRRRPGPRRRR